MSVWKSPVFYFGIILLLLVSFALVAPFIINWNAWKPELESYGRRLTGRNVDIVGNVDVRLFPWPRLTAHNLTLANAEGFGDAPLLAADSMTTRFSLAGLFSATLQVEEIEFDSPQFNLVRSKDGRMNWRLAPDAALGRLLSRVKLDHIALRNGGIWFEDKLRDQSHSLTNINANLAGQALEGPWRLIGKGTWRETALAFSVSTGVYDQVEGLKLTLTATPDDIELPVFGLDGHWKGEHMLGNLRLTGQEAGEGKGSIQDKLRPLALQAAYDLQASAVNLSKIRIAPVDKQDSGTLIEGDASVSFVPETKAQLRLTAPRINLDTVLGAGSMARWRRGGLLAVANSIFAELPPKASGSFSLDVNVLTANGQSLNDVKLSGTAERAAIRIKNASANLPGRTRAKFDGVIFPASGAADLGGALAFESNDLRAFVNWLAPQHADLIKQYWTGNRGSLKFQGDINWSAQRLALQQAAYELDGQPGEASANLTFGELPQVLLSLDAKALDLDAYVASPSGDGLHWTPPQLVSLLPMALDLGQVLEHRLLLSVDALTFNGVNATGADIDYSSSLSGLEIKAFNLTAAGGAAFKTEGLVINGAEGPVGEIDLGISAQDVRGLLQLVGLTNAAHANALASIAGATEAKLAVAIAPGNGAPLAKIEGSAQSGGLKAVTSGEFSSLDAKQGPSFKGRIALEAPELRPALQSLGAANLQTGPVSATMNLDGSAAAGYAADVSLQALQSGLSYKGKFSPTAPYWGLDGVVAAEASSLKVWRDALGLPIATSTDAPLSWRGTLIQKNGALQLVPEEDARGNFAFAATMAASGEFSADIETGPMALQDIMGIAFLPWRGANADLGNSFASPEDALVFGEIFLRPSVLQIGGQSTRESIVGISTTKKARRLTIKSPRKELDFDVAVAPQGSSFDVSGKGRVALDLAPLTTVAAASPAAAGQIIVEGDFSGTGRSPAAVLQSLQGKGRYWLESATLNNLTAAGFGAALATATTPDELGALLDRTSQPPGTGLPAQTGYVTIANGLAAASRMSLKTADELLLIEPSQDLASGEIAIRVTLQATRRNDLPPITYSYSGPPGALRLRKGTAALAAKLGYELMSQEMARLEQLQQQEQENLAREEQQRIADQQRYDAFQAQRGELRQRLRELRFHQTERARLREARAAEMAKALKDGDAINRVELARRTRELALRRRLSEPFVQP
jgi:hypothetical protein